MTKAASTPPAIRECVLVLGMHRSGTSALAGTLSQIGCVPPASLIRADANNEKGYFESNAVGRLSDAIFEARNTAWDDWVPLGLDALPEDQLQGFHERACQVVDEDFAEALLFVLKEPRICRMIPFWRKVLEQSGCAIRCVHIHRNPQEVAASLARRDGFDPAFSLLIWLRHVLEAEHATRGLPRTFTSYHHLLQDWRKVVEKLKNELGVRLTIQSEENCRAVEDFLSARLQHFRDEVGKTLSNPTVSQNIRDTLVIMERWANRGEQTVDQSRLDEIRCELNELALTFAPLARPGQMAILALRESESRRNALQNDLVERESEAKKLQAALNEKKLASEKLRTALAEKEIESDARLEALQHTLIERGNEAKKLQAVLSAEKVASEKLRTALAEKEIESDARLEALQHTLIERGNEAKKLQAVLSAEKVASEKLRTALAEKEIERVKLLEKLQARDRSLEGWARTVDSLRSRMN